MSSILQKLGIDQLSAQDRLLLLGEIWESLSLHDMPVPESHRDEVDRRLAAAQSEPGASLPWEEVRARLLRER